MKTKLFTGGLLAIITLSGCTTGSLSLPHIPGKNVRVEKFTKRIIYPYGTIEVEMLGLDTQVVAVGTNQVPIPTTVQTGGWYGPGGAAPVIVNPPATNAPSTTIDVPADSAVTVRPR